MRYCLKYTKNKYIQEADEILFADNHGDDMIDAIELYPHSDFIYEVVDQVDDWDYLKMINSRLNKTDRRLIISTMYSIIAQEAKENGLAFYFSFAINNFADLQTVNKLGACYALITAPIFFEQDKLEKFSIPLRYRANVAYSGYLTTKRVNANAAFIRPDDVEFYDNDTTTIEFGASSSEQEEVLYRLYKYDKTWPGDLNMVITTLNVEPAPMNRMIGPDFTKHRLNCGQRCVEGDTLQCHLCHNQMLLAVPSKIKNYIDNVILPVRTNDQN